MGKSILKVQPLEAGEIKKLLNTNDEYAVGIRLYLVYLVALGHSSRKLSEFHKISFKQINNWVHRFEKDGIEGLKNKGGCGRRSVLSDEQLNRIKELVLKEAPANYGFPSGNGQGLYWRNGSKRNMGWSTKKHRYITKSK